MLKRSLIVGTSVLALGVAAPAYAAFQGPTTLPTPQQFEDSGAQVNSAGVVIETLTADIQNVRINTLDGSFTNSDGGNGASGAVNVQQNNGNNNAVNAGTGIVAGVGTAEESLGSSDGPETGHTNDVFTGAFAGIPGSDGFFDKENANLAANNQAFVFGLYPGLELDDGDPDTPNQEVFLLADGTAVLADGTLVDPADVIIAEKTPDRLNTITTSDATVTTNGSFENFSGVVNVQQNNGDANVLAQSQGIFTNQGRQSGTQAQFGGVNNAVVDAGRNFATNEPFGQSIFDGEGELESDQTVAALEGMGGGLDDYFEELETAFDTAGGALFDLLEDANFPINGLVDLNTYFRNVIDNNSFDNATGSIQVTQNNGNSNAIGAATQVIANNLGSITASPGDVVGNGVSGGSTSTTIASAGYAVGGSVWDGDFNIEEEVATLPALVLPAATNYGEDETFGTDDDFLVPAGEALAKSFDDSAEAAIEFFYGSLGSASLAEKYQFDLEHYQLPNLSTTKENLITDSFDNATALATVQQNNGHANTIGAATQVAVRLGVEDKSQLLANAVVDGASIYNITFEFGVDRDNTIDTTFTDFAGSANVQQNNGHNNSMNIATSINAGLEEDSPLFGEKGGTNSAELRATVARNTVIALSDDAYENTISDAFNGLGRGFTGVANVQQNNGSSNVLNSAVAVSFTGAGGLIEAP